MIPKHQGSFGIGVVDDLLVRRGSQTPLVLIERGTAERMIVQGQQQEHQGERRRVLEVKLLVHGGGAEEKKKSQCDGRVLKLPDVPRGNIAVEDGDLPVVLFVLQADD